MDERQRCYYRAYLLRLWCEEPTSPYHAGDWRASLRAVDGDLQIGFATLDELCTYLRQEPNRTKHPHSTD